MSDARAGSGARDEPTWAAKLTPARQAQVDVLVEQVAALRREVKQLQAEVHDDRRLHRRVAELTDVVAELLLPAAERDEQRLNELLERYRTH